MLPEFRTTIEQARSESVQDTSSKMPFGVVWLAKTGLFVSSWWSPKRDKELRNFWKKSDHLSSAIYNLICKMTAIPFQIFAKDTSDRAKTMLAEHMTELIRATAQFGEGWTVFLSRFIEDMVTQDNGAFAEIIGPGDPNGPLTGAPIAFAHLDASKCQRTGNPEFPVIYRDNDGKMYKLHYTRVMYAAQMPSPIAEMYGVGFCGVSRCINIAQTLIDILTFKQEKLGSRPHRAIIITRGGLDPKDMADAFAMAEGDMDAQGLSRYSKVVVAGSSAIEDAGADVIELSSLPEGFDEKTSMDLGMAAIALALGMDANELFPGAGGGASRANALIQHMKQRGRGPGQIVEVIEQLFNNKYLPEGFYMQFNFQDDQVKRQEAEIRQLRSSSTNVELINGVMNDRSAREQMLLDDEIDTGQFEMLELMDGRLEDGTDVLGIFYRDIPSLAKYMDLGVADPLDFGANNPAEMYQKCYDCINVLRREVVNIDRYSNMYPYRNDSLKVLSGLLKLKQVYLYLVQAGVNDKIGKIMKADEAISLLDDEPELGQKFIAKSLNPLGPMFGQQDGQGGPAQGGAPMNGNIQQRSNQLHGGAQPGPQPGVARPGDQKPTRQGAGSVNGDTVTNPRDGTKPRFADQHPAAKEVDDEQEDPF